LDNLFTKYTEIAKQKGILNALIINSSDICFDIRTNLKCGWGCERNNIPNLKCDSRGTSFEERVRMVKQYNTILLLHSHNAKQISEVILEIEKIAFLDGHYFAFALRACKLCPECLVKKEKECPQPAKIRPCEALFGIDVYKTVRQLGLPCEVLQNEDDIQNRYGFLLIE
jgi:predicted metal-binding protein